MIPDMEGILEIVRLVANLPEHEHIHAQTTIQEDIGLDGDDGWEMIEKIWAQYSLRQPDDESEFNRAFAIAPTQFLFYPEGLSFGQGSELISLFGTSPFDWKGKKQRVITVGELYAAALKFLPDAGPEHTNGDEDA
jgi:hypothetical protein